MLLLLVPLLMPSWVLWSQVTFRQQGSQTLALAAALSWGVAGTHQINVCTHMSSSETGAAKVPKWCDALPQVLGKRVF